MTKKRQVPEVFRRVYGDNARTLRDAILALLPSPLPSSNCACDDGRCLRCMGPADRSSAILRPGDPVEYHRLLTRACAVVSDQAPRLHVFDPTHHLEQRYIVQLVIQLMLSDSSKYTNMICAGYEKLHQTNNVIDNLSDPAWSLLLTRIGDEVMVHLLKYSSIFLFLPSNNHFQVTGCPIYKSLSSSKICKYKQHCKPLMPQNQRPLLTTVNFSGPLKNIVVENREKSKSSIGMEMQTSGSSWSIKNYEGSVFYENSAQPRKRVRPFSWQRCRKRRNTNSLDVVPQRLVQGGYALSGVVLNSSTGMLNHRICTSSQVDLLEKQRCEKKSLSCHCCLMLQRTPRGHAREVEIEKQWMFYNSRLTPSLFPKNHILNRLKPNDKGAASLMRNIFCLQDRDTSSGFWTSILSDRFCPFGSECQLYSLLAPLKSLIRRFHRCHYLKILNKHCGVPTSRLCSDRKSGNMSKEREIDTSLSLFRVLTLQKKYSHLKPLSKQSFLKSYGRFSNKGEVFSKKTHISNKQFEDLNGAYCQQQQVVSFIWAICRSVIPLDLLGTPSNWRALRRNISKLVQLRRFEKFNLRQCMHGLKTAQVPFLSKITWPSCKDVQLLKRAFFERWIFWFFSCAVVPIVVAHFYVTESETGRHSVFYYQKQVWKKINDGAVAHLRRTTYHLFDPDWLGQVFHKRTLGFSKVRFLPKERGIRSLVNLKAPSSVLLSDQKFCFKNKYVKATYLRDFEVINFRSVNSNLCDLHAILKSLKVENPDKLGSSVFDYNDIYERLFPFITRVRRNLPMTARFFIVGCDVRKAFDTIDQDKLIHVMNEILQKSEYHLQKVAQVHCTKDAVRVHYDQVAVNVGSNANIMKYTSLVPDRSSHSVHVNQFRVKQLRNQCLLHLLHEHVKGNLVLLGPYLYLQHVGIPQGSVLSSLLCSFYYASLEKRIIFPWLQKIQKALTFGFEKSGLQHDGPALSKYILLRLIDDFLFISTSEDLAIHFLSRMQRGFREYNCKMNEGKFSVNFDIRDKCAGFQSNRIYKGEDGVSFLPWSGLLINCCTLEIQADYTRYWGIHMSSTITASNQAKPRLTLKRKLCDYVRPKCHPLFYDSNINGSRTVRLNVYQAFLVCAMKFHCYMCAVPNLSGLCPKYCLQIIQKSISYMYKLIWHQMHSPRLRYNFSPILKLKKKETDWLGLSAYIRILRKKQSRHIELLRMLKAKLQMYRELENTQELQYAVDDSHSSLLWKIKF
ncbi:telomerase reverse transcriptase [Aristolochia californica]|uniref:telomerase reverse transcriptase n=1 Tax=Aristolochia californica TaxID=171875 RepID=UPI0035DCE3B7